VRGGKRARGPGPGHLNARGQDCKGEKARWPQMNERGQGCEGMSLYERKKARG
jgi:hypothetical protein